MNSSAVEETLSSNLYVQQVKKLYNVGKILGLNEDVLDTLAQPERVIQVKIEIKGKDGQVRTFMGWRSQHNSALGPYKGGVRYHPNVTQDEVVALSMMMTWKNALLLLPYGGGKGGIRVDPSKLTQDELEQLSRRYVGALYKYIGSDIDIPAPDVNTNPQTMAWYVDEYIKITGRADYAAFTGKPIELGGLPARIYSTGLGVATTARLAAEKVLGGIEGARVLIQGFGNVGSFTAKFLEEMGAKIVGISDIKGGVINYNGIDVKKALEVKDNTGSVFNYPDGKKVTNEEFLVSDCDILIPAAIENVIHKFNAPKVKAKLIVEGANGPLTADADVVMKDRGIMVVPDILANAGGVVGSYVEWANNKMGEIMDEEEARKLIVSRMERAFDYVYTKYNKLGDQDMRTAAMAMAIERVVNAMKVRGKL
ncbi:Glu/Leu/Phe/Val family dehydrogenase [Sulfolobus acidocaldarius]|uniref:Glutamate dehydrogenase n=4 Tax=Sulfolobus acidocaldarius TaxID=2285 RepID=Q4JCA3_SULAC|nr:Glu/Leu/Phe/Val dehydrogenase [Sulfolobus acidocaldarius]AAY79576.1 glutamate dehydrogenase [Sulfolobus acidocaldarius DSM 639]AGE70129.1 glutamate dehydrogenase [Sulfolobus acidocaldarius N8]AGE72404.1 glutamate dehydrogenase [Sulfolobus acidocaldarius Ron12/I]ALU29457.1 glutamate dehydrogenase [Sulfolobus acidocaldarius]ALU32186.1 glutamate dehydrogenase [Sulfolobus acidocaldarius]